jgi:RNA polymerase sigma-70 factor (ECF subfamily)
VGGDRAAVAEVLGVVRPLVHRYCLGRLGTRLDGIANAEDCAQDILLAVVAALPRYCHDPAGFLPFVFGIAAHKVADAHRRRAREVCAPVPEPPVGAWQGMDPTLDEIERLDSLERSSGLLDSLPPRQREVLVLRIVLGFSAEETAAAVGMSSAGAVRVAQHRALTTLRRALRRRQGLVA